MCGLEWFLNESNNYCNNCNDFYVKKVHKAKETDIKNFLYANNIICETEDKIPDGACSKYRPDFVIDMKLFKCIIEVDENQHKSYACECEQSRMIQIHQDYGGVPIISSDIIQILIKITKINHSEPINQDRENYLISSKDCKIDLIIVWS